MEKWKTFDAEETVPLIDPDIEASLVRLSKAVWENREEKSLRPKYRGKLC